MKLIVTIHIVENGYVVSYRDYVKREQPQNQYLPTIEPSSIVTIDRNVIIQSEEEITALLKELRAKASEIPW